MKCSYFEAYKQAFDMGIICFWNLINNSVCLDPLCSTEIDDQRDPISGTCGQSEMLAIQFKPAGHLSYYSKTVDYTFTKVCWTNSKIV